MRYTKWDFLSDTDRAAFDRDSLNVLCSGCGTNLPTEGSFYRHFVIPDARYLNLGECPSTDKGRAILHTINLRWRYDNPPRVSVRKPVYPV